MFAILININSKFFRECVYTGYTNTMKTSRNLVTFTAKFSACMQLCQNDFNCTFAFFWNDASWDTTTIIDNRARAVCIDDNINLSAVASQCFINRVVHNFLNKVMESVSISRADIHARTLTNRFKPFQNLNFTGVIFYAL